VQTKELVRELEERFGEKGLEVEETIEETRTTEEEALYVSRISLEYDDFDGLATNEEDLFSIITARKACGI